jgi:hypothetical protein
VRRLDPVHDLVVLVTDDPLPVSVAGLSASDDVVGRTPILVIGVGSGLEDPGHTVRHLPADGHWVAGGTTRDDQIRLGVVDSKRVSKGMSGARAGWVAVHWASRRVAGCGRCRGRRGRRHVPRSGPRRGAAHRRATWAVDD